MPSFLDIRLPIDIETGARGGLGFNTTVLESNSGAQQRNINWSQAKYRGDISFGIRNRADLIGVYNFHLVCHGRAFGFRFKDWHDYIMPRQTIAVGDGVTTEFPVFKEYEVDGFTYRHPITRVVDGTFSFWVNGAAQGLSSAYSLDINTGIVIASAAPAVGEIVEFACHFDRPVHFDIDRLDIQAIIAEDKDEDDTTEQDEGLEGITAIPIEELKERVDD